LVRQRSAHSFESHGEGTAQEEHTKGAAPLLGVPLAPGALLGVVVGDLSYRPLAILSALAAIFFIFQAKVPCCAEKPGRHLLP
jgi:hypothetical protein